MGRNRGSAWPLGLNRPGGHRFSVGGKAGLLHPAGDRRAAGYSKIQCERTLFGFGRIADLEQTASRAQGRFRRAEWLSEPNVNGHNRFNDSRLKLTSEKKQDIYERRSPVHQRGDVGARRHRRWPHQV